MMVIDDDDEEEEEDAPQQSLCTCTKKGMKQITSLSIIIHWHDMYHHSYKGFYAQSSQQAN